MNGKSSRNAGIKTIAEFNDKAIPLNGKLQFRGCNWLQRWTPSLLFAALLFLGITTLTLLAYIFFRT